MQQQQIEETLKLKRVTCGNLAVPKGKLKVESDQIQFSLQLKDAEWKPRLRRKNWNAMSKTFTMVSLLQLFFTEWGKK